MALSDGIIEGLIKGLVNSSGRVKEGQQEMELAHWGSGTTASPAGAKGGADTRIWRVVLEQITT